MDLFADSYQSYDYHQNGHYYWSQTTIAIVFVPLATICISEILRHAIAKKSIRAPITLMSSLKTIVKHIPFVQPFVHLLYLKDLKLAKDQMEKSLQFYKSFDPKMVTEENRKSYQEDVTTAADDFVRAKEKYMEIMTDFQKMKLYEAFGESAPQAALQIGIVLQVGTLSTTQIVTICTSFLSLTLGASEILLMMATKDKSIKESSWKATWLLIFPAMFMVVVPRIMTISLIIAYTKGFFLIFIAVFLVLSIGINFHHLKRDPPEVMVGMLTNLFAPAIVVQEGSGFYKRSGIGSSLLHVLGILSLFLMVIGNTIDTCPDSNTNRQAPILHCFRGKFSPDFSIQRCEWPENLTKSHCTEAFESFSTNDYEILVQPKCDTIDLLSTDVDPARSVTFCGESISWWSPLAMVSGVLVLWHFVSILLISTVLCKSLDAIGILKMSKSCCISRFLEPVWDEEKGEELNPILEFLKNPTHNFKKTNDTFIQTTGQDLVTSAIQNDYYEIMRLVLYESNEPFKMSMMKLAVKFGSPKMIKLLLKKAKEDLARNGKLSWKK